MYGHLLNNRNVKLVSVGVAVLGIVLAVISSFLFSNWAMDVNKDYDKALKFSDENAVEFPYSIKTQQGNLIATGEVKAVSPLVTNENIDGEYLAITETEEEYTHHHETYECGYSDSDGNYHSKTCTRDYWSWDYRGSEKWRVETVSLLGQEMSSSFLPWEDWASYNLVKTKDGKSYRRSGNLRWYYKVIYPGLTGTYGFTSDQDGFRYNGGLAHNDMAEVVLNVLKWFFIIVFSVGGLALAIWLYYENYEYYDNFV